jgi:hypothetical protein
MAPMGVGDWETVRAELPKVLADTDIKRFLDRTVRMLVRGLQLVMERLEQPARIRREDLIGPCPACRGTGRVVEVGTGGRSQIPRPDSCGACEGTGQQLTETGRVIASFIRDVRARADI